MTSSGANRQPSSKRPETYQQRARRYERIEKTTTWIGAGLVVLIALVGADVIDAAPSWLMAVVVTFIVCGGGLLAETRILFEWHATILKRAIEDDIRKKDKELPADLQPMPRLGKAMFLVSWVFTILAGFFIVVGAWWPVIYPLLKEVLAEAYMPSVGRFFVGVFMILGMSGSVALYTGWLSREE
jgi:hypothetical protein